MQMPITLRDDIPVQRAYSAVPKPLFNEVKGYIQDLLAKGWVVKSKSPYSAPVVCVRKKYGKLRLCVDYSLLNKKTIPDRHPLPRIQDLIDTLGGYSWFSILDQGKAYHQGFIAEGSRYMTAFITPWGCMSGSVSHLDYPMFPLPSNAAWRKCLTRSGMSVVSHIWTMSYAMRDCSRNMWRASAWS